MDSNEGTDSQSSERMTLETSLFLNLNDPEFAQCCVHEVISCNSLKIVYQPVVNHVKNVIFGHEALSRPRFRETPIQPESFFQAAYEYERSTEVDILALTAAVTTARRHDIQTNPLFVNVVPESLMEHTYVQHLELLFSTGTYRPEQLVIEITEHVSYDPISLRPIVDEIRSFGVRIALDDIGVGEANLRALVHIEPDFAKVDRSLIQDISKCKSKQRLLSHLVGFMESGCSVIAEGIENSEDLLAVKQAGVCLSQGYYWAHPTSAEKLTSALGNIGVKSTSSIEQDQCSNTSYVDAVKQYSEPVHPYLRKSPFVW